MISTDPRRRRSIVPVLQQLESRRLLSFSVTSARQDGSDFVGPDASQGGDGIQDLHLSLSGINTGYPVNYILVSPPGGVAVGSYAWETPPLNGGGASLESGYSEAEFVPNTQERSLGDLYINPQVRAVAPPAGTGSPPSLGGSTGSIIDLENGDSLDVTVYYQGTTYTDSFTFQLGGSVGSLTSPTDPMPTVPTPSNVVGTFQVHVDGQDGSAPPSIGEGYKGMVHLALTAPSGITFSSGEFNSGSTVSPFAFEISDLSGQWWDSTPSSQLHQHIYAYYDSSTVANLYFPPVLDEAPVNGSTAYTMLLQVTLTTSTVYATPFMGANWNLALLTDTPGGTAPGYPANGTALQADINDGYGTIDLQPGTTILSSEPIQITHSVTIIGSSGSTLEFSQQGAVWSSSTTQGALYVSTGGGLNLSVTLEDFTIDFANTTLQWDNPSGDSPTQYDPNDNVAGLDLAVINDNSNNQNYNIDDWTLSGMTIDGPPAFDVNQTQYTPSYATLQSYAASQNPPEVYVGEPDIPLFNANSRDFGIITGSTFAGGPLKLTGGPWTITNNVVQGAVADTYSTEAFAIDGAHDALIQGNTVTEAASSGYLFRLVDFGGASSDNTVEDNSITEPNVGYAPNEMGCSNCDPNGIISLGAPAGWGSEVILQETGDDVYFEGRPGAISQDGLLLVLPEVRASIVPLWSGTPTGVGLVVSILSGVNSNGSPSMSQAGEWFRVTQQVSFNSSNDQLELLMQDPLPQMPSGGYYVVELTGGAINNAFINNSVNTFGTPSQDLDIGAPSFGARAIGNDLVGGSTLVEGQTGTAINAGAGSNSKASGTLPAGWTVLPSLGTVIENNIIQDALGGIQLGVQHDVNYWDTQVTSVSDTGRVYDTASVIDNVFKQDAQSWLAQYWDSAYVTTGYNNTAESSLPPTVTVGSGFGGTAPGSQAGPRFPWTVGNAMVENNPHTPIFVDPIENQIDVQGNSAYEVQANGSLTLESEPTGQVYAGFVNGTDYDGSLAADTDNNTSYPGYNGSVYYPFNVNTGLAGDPDQGNQLNINDAPAGTQGIQALMLGQDNYDLVGAGSGTAAPDGTQDLHIQLTGLSPASTLSSLVVTDTVDGEQWLYPQSGSSPQIVWQWGTGATTADIFIQPTIGHLDDPFTIQLTYAAGGPITIPVQGVLFDPSLPELPAAPQAPTGLGVTGTTSSTVSLAWVAPAGATSYILERAPANSPGSWTVVNGDIAATSYTDTGLSSSTAYNYEIRATGALGNSPFSSTAAATTTSGSQGDTLAATAVALNLTENSAFNGTVCTFTDTNTSRSASSFTATISWGDGTPGVAGTVSGSNGSYIVSGSQIYPASGNFNIQVQIGMVSPYTGAASTVSTAVVSQPLIKIGFSGVYNQVGITSPGSNVQGQLGTAGDESYSSTALGGSTIYWNSNPYLLGPVNADNVIEATGQTLSLNCANCSALDILAAATLGTSQGGIFQVNYSDGSHDQYTLGLSDWNLGYDGLGTNAPGEATVLTMQYLDIFSSGTNSQTSTKTFLYGYVIPTSASKTITGLGLPTDSSIKILAMDEIMQPPQLDLSTYFTKVGITTPGSTVEGQADQYGNSLSSQALGTTVSWDGQTFDMGTPNADDIVLAGGQWIAITQGSYTSLYILAMATGYGQSMGGVFRIDYTNGSYDQYTLGVSDWGSGYTGTGGTTAPGESIAETMTARDTWNGTEDVSTTGTVYVYGYVLPVDPSRTIQDLSLPNNNNIKILAVNAVDVPPQTSLVSVVDHTTSNGYTIPANADGITEDTNYGVGSINGSGNSFSDAALNNPANWTSGTVDV